MGPWLRRTPPLQRKHGIRDSAKQMYKDMMAAGLGLNHPELVRTVADNAADVFRWTQETLKVRYKDRADIFGGHSVARGHTTHNRSGSAIVVTGAGTRTLTIL